MADYLDTASVKQLHFIDPVKAGTYIFSPPNLIHFSLSLSLSLSLTLASLLDIPQIDTKITRSSMLGRVGRRSFVKVPVSVVNIW